jgi:FixJ family two-component response regulator
MNTVKNSGCNGFADDEIFGMAVHYFDEDIIEVGKPITGHVVVNHTISLSETEQAEAKEAAMKKAVAEQLSHLTAKPKVVKKEVVVGDQISLF